MIGKETGRIVQFATGNGYCRTCDSVKRSGRKGCASRDYHHGQ